MAPRSLQFSSFILDLDRLCLYGHDGKAELRPKSFEVLRYLIEHSGRVVGKEEVINAVWPDVTVTDESLTRCISEVRRAIDDGSQQIIKTVPKRGYLFDVPVSEAARTAAPPETGASAADSLSLLIGRIPNRELEESALAGERKQVTVLHADVKESLERIAERDPEGALKIFEAVLPLMTQAVDRYEGKVNIVTDDGIVALFGVPLAHEDHAIRACYAALQLQESVARYSEGLQHPTTLAVRVCVGVDSGEAVVRSIADGVHSKYRVMGRTVNRAARLGQIAEPGTSIISADTLRLAEGHIEVRTIERANGSLSDQPGYELIGTGPVRTRFQASAARGLTGFVGRSSEMEQLDRARARAEQRHSQVVAIIGEPGLGKSRLVYEFAGSSALRGWLKLESACVSYGTGTSYFPLIALLKNYFNIETGDDVRAMRHKVVRQLLNIDQAFVADLPALLALLDIPVEDSSWPSLDALERRQRTLDALKRLIFRQCQEVPMMLVCEDLHWIDRETQAFLGTLIDGLASAPLLLVLTYRPEYEHRWGSKSYYTQLRLDSLTPEVTQEFLSNLLGDDPSVIPLKSMLPTSGTPFFLEETVRTLIETRLLEGSPGNYRLVGSLQDVPTPASVQSILAARIDRLPARDKRLLHAAAVVGKDVPHAILKPVLGFQEGELRRGLAKLQEAEFLYEARLFPDLEYAFKHALTHEVAYASLLVDERRALHRQVVNVIEHLYPERLAEQIERLAHHAVRGELWEKAVGYLKAEARSSLQDARRWFEEALAVLEKLPESRSTLEQGFDIRLELRPVLIRLAEAQRQLERLHEAELLAEKLNDDRRLGQVYALTTHAHLICGTPDAALLTGAHALEIATRLGDLRLRIHMTTYLEHGHHHRAEYERVVELATHNLAALPAEWTYECLGGTVAIAIIDRFFLITSLAELGRFAEAAKHEDQVIRLAEPIDHLHTIAIAYEASGIFRLLKGDWARARSLIENGIMAAEKGNIVSQRTFLLASSAWALSRLGETSLALERLRESEKLLEAHAARGYFGRIGWGYYLLGCACLKLGRLNEAKRFGDLAVECSPRHPGFAARGLQLVADTAAHHLQFNFEASERSYRAALALAEPRSMRPLVAHCHHGLAKLYVRAGDRRNGQEHATTAMTMYRDMGIRIVDLVE
jgi:DNA-binding winged helix-turn-helix (wHTH) protein/tetratricopeptide (TPR) repeat protein